MMVAELIERDGRTGVVRRGLDAELVSGRADPEKL